MCASLNSDKIYLIMEKLSDCTGRIYLHQKMPNLFIISDFSISQQRCYNLSDSGQNQNLDSTQSIF